MNKLASVTALTSLALLLIASTQLAVAAEDEGAAKEKLTIKEVMTTAHKDGLLAKVLKDEATPEEKLKLLDLYIDLAESEPPQGDEKAWKDRTAQVVLSVGKVVVGRKGANAELKKSADCMACHGVHKPKTE